MTNRNDLTSQGLGALRPPGESSCECYDCNPYCIFCEARPEPGREMGTIMSDGWNHGQVSFLYACRPCCDGNN